MLIYGPHVGNTRSFSACSANKNDYQSYTKIFVIYYILQNISYLHLIIRVYTIVL